MASIIWCLNKTFTLEKTMLIADGLIHLSEMMYSILDNFCVANNVTFNGFGGMIGLLYLSVCAFIL